ncbi:antirestriction protein [Klebsiella pneumoniae]|uniref:antirestriction protein n=1 Tax=Klebsiella pneumoniae TaxID=573 RepID=UPI003B66F3D7
MPAFEWVHVQLHQQKGMISLSPPTICNSAQKMMPEYQGGFWHFIRLPDGGGYMMPDGDRFHMVNGANWFDRTVSADAAGIILTSLVINRQLWLYHDSGDAGLTQLYRMRDAQLWRHIEFHPECNAIYAALD